MFAMILGGSNQDSCCGRLRSRCVGLQATIILVFVGASRVSIALPPESQVAGKSYETVIALHESQVASLYSGKCSWLVEQIAPSSSITEKFVTTFSPGYERTASFRADGRQDVLWDGTHFRRMFDFDGSVKNDPRLAERIKAFRYGRDYSLGRLFNWRSMRAIRLFAADSDWSLRELCARSPTPPVVSIENELIAINLTHAGAFELDKLVCVGGKLRVLIDPTVGHHIRSYSTHCGDFGVFTQEVVSFENHGEVFYPTKVRFIVEAQNARLVQEINLDFSMINEAIDLDKPFFPENVLVSDSPSFEAEATQFFVVDAQGELGSPFYRELEAANARYNQIGRKLSLTGGKTRDWTQIAFWATLLLSLSYMVLIFAKKGRRAFK